VIPLRDQEYIRERFERGLEGRVKIDYFTQRASALFVPGREECVYCEEAQQMLEEVASLSEKLSLTVHDVGEAQELAKKLGIDKVPGIVIRGPANRPLRFFGMPGGNEFPNFIETMIDASKQQAQIGAEPAKQLKKLRDTVSVVVYVTPTCPHCPAVVRAAYRLALASAHVQASAVEIGEFPRIAQQLGVRAVPLTVIDGRAAIAGAVDEAGLLDAIHKVVTDDTSIGRAPVRAGAVTDAAPPDAPAAQPGAGLILPR
jgi:glutaredoxin-like protein